MGNRPRFWLSSALILLIALMGTTYEAHAQNTSPILERTTPEVFQVRGGGNINYTHFGAESPFRVAIYGGMLTHLTNPHFDVFTREEGMWQNEDVSLPHTNSSFQVLNLDFDRDGLEDLVVRPDYRPVMLYRNKGTADTPVFGQGTRLIDAVERISAVDANKDGYEDLIYRYEREDKWGRHVEHHDLALNNRGHGLLAGQQIAALSGRRLRFASDLNGDGHVDLIARGSEKNRILAGDGTGQFTEQAGLERGNLADFTSIDVDGDGAQNLIAAQVAEYHDWETENRSTTYHLNNLSFDTDFQITRRQVGVLDSLSGLSRLSVSPVDFSGDGRTDLIVSGNLDDSENAVDHFFRADGDSLTFVDRRTARAIDPLPFTRSPTGSLYRMGKKDDALPQDNQFVEETVREPEHNAAPASPRNLRASSEDNSATLRWGAPTGDETPAGQLYYHVQLENLDTDFVYKSRRYSSFFFSENEDPYFGAQSRTERNFSFLPAGQYEARVRTVDAGQQMSELSDPVRFSISTSLSPPTPQGVNAQAQDGGIIVRFSMLAFFDSVRVYRSTASEAAGTHIGTVSSNSYQYLDRDVTAGQQYYYRLQAFLNDEVSTRTEAVAAESGHLVPSTLSIAEEGYDLHKIVRYDLNQDGFEDLIARTRSPRNERRVKVVPGTATGFDPGSATVLMENVTTTLRLDTFVDDWNNDLNPDLIVFNRNEQEARILLLDGFTVIETRRAPTGIDVGRGNEALTMQETADLDADGRADLVLANYGEVVIGWNEKAGSISLDTITTSAQNPYNTCLLDYDQDGDQDLMAGDQANRAPVMYDNSGDRTFERKFIGLPQRSDDVPQAWIYEDYQQVWLNEDIYPDLLIRRTKASEPDSIGTRYPVPVHELYVYDEASETYEKHPLDFGEAANEQGIIRPAHFDNNGYVDFVAVFPEGMRIWMNENNESFERKRYTLSSDQNLINVFNSDGDGDGDADTFFSLSEDQTLFFFENAESSDNEQPTAPASIQASGSAQALNISWEDSRDDKTLSGHLAYGAILFSDTDTLRVGTINPASGAPLSAAADAGVHRNALVLDDVPPGKYTLKLAAIDPLGEASGFSEEISFSVTETGVDVGDVPSAKMLSLDSAYPNPFRQSTTIRFTLLEAGRVTLTVYDALGRKVRVLKHGVFSPGKHEVKLQADGLSSGVYLYRLQAPTGTRTARVAVSR
jgi:hypothetical protein